MLKTSRPLGLRVVLGLPSSMPRAASSPSVYRNKDVKMIMIRRMLSLIQKPSLEIHVTEIERKVGQAIFEEKEPRAEAQLNFSSS
jgi:hypothetical protein